MLAVTVDHDIPRLRQILSGVQRQIPFAISQAINETAFDLKRHYEKNTLLWFNRPIKFTQTGFRVGKATKTRLEGSVFVESARRDYLRRQIQGSRNQKRIVPTAKSINAYGNLPRGFVRRKRGGKNIFFGKPAGRSDLPPGIWQRQGPGGRKAIRLLDMFVDDARHQPNFPYFASGRAFILRNIERNFRRSLDRALRTAR